MSDNIAKEKKPAKTDISDTFGIIKKRKMSGQEFKDMVREGWMK